MLEIEGMTMTTQRQSNTSNKALRIEEGERQKGTSDGWLSLSLSSEIFSSSQKLQFSIRKTFNKKTKNYNSFLSNTNLVRIWLLIAPSGDITNLFGKAGWWHRLSFFFFLRHWETLLVCVCVCVCSCNMSICVWSRLRVWQTSRERERQERVSELISERSEKGEQGKQGIHNSHFVVVVVVVLCVFRSQVNNFLIFFSEGRNTPPERKWIAGCWHKSELKSGEKWNMIATGDPTIEKYKKKTFFSN